MKNKKIFKLIVITIIAIIVIIFITILGSTIKTFISNTDNPTTQSYNEDGTLEYDKFLEKNNENNKFKIKILELLSFI